MQTVCPWCSYSLAVDDSKVPKRPFAMRCSKCHGTMQLPGDGAPRPSASKLAAPPTGASPSPPSSPPTPPSSPAQTASAAPEPPARDMPARDINDEREKASSEEPSGSALVVLGDPRLAQSATSMLSNMGYAVDGSDDWEEKARLLQQGDYNVVMTGRGGAFVEEKKIYQRMSQLSPEARRRTFLVLIGDEFKSGDGNEAFVAGADLVLPPSGQSFERILKNRIAERARVYRAFNDAGNSRHRH